MEWLTEFVLGPADNFRKKFMTYSLGRKIFFVPIIILVLLIGYFFQPISEAIISAVVHDAPNTSSTSNGPCSVATNNQSGGVNAPCSNSVAAYSLIHDSTTHVIEDHERFRRDFEFQANGSILPSRACFNLKSDVEIIDVSLSLGTLTNGNESDLPSKNYTECAEGYGSHVIYQVYFDSSPRAVTAELIGA